MSRSEGFGAEVKRRIFLGTFALSSDITMHIIKIAKVRTLIKMILIEYLKIMMLLWVPLRQQLLSI